MDDPSNDPNSIANEPALSGLTDGVSTDADNGIGGEPVLVGNETAEKARKEHEAEIAEQWRLAGNASHTAMLAKMILCAGFLAVVCAFFGEHRVTSRMALLSTVIIGPLVEEFGKVILPLMTLEKKPWRFASDNAILGVCLVSGFVFAAIENLLYFFVYIPEDELTAWIIAFRLTACTALHMICTALSGYGLARCWRVAHDARTETDLRPAMHWLIAAVVLHGLFNAAATLYAIFEKG